MKQLFNKAFVMLAVCALAVAATSCNAYDAGTAPETSKTTITVKNSLRGTILDQDGAAVTGASVTINGAAVAVSSNSFEKTGLNDGTYTIVVKKAGFKDSEPKVVTLAKSTEIVNGESTVVGQDATCVIYLNKDNSVTTSAFSGTSGTSKTIDLETSTQDDGTGVVNSTTGATVNKITVKVTTPNIDAADVPTINGQLPAGTTVSDITYTITNLNSPEEASRSTIVAGEALPGNYTFLTGAKLITAVDVDFAAMGLTSYTIDVTIDLGDNDMKNGIALFRYLGGSWTQVTANDTDMSFDNSQDSKLIVKLSRLRAQSFAIGIQIDETVSGTANIPVVATPVVNSNAAAMSVPSMNYTAKERGVVISNQYNTAMVDFLRKAVLRYKGLTAVSSENDQAMTYTFSPAYSLPVGGTLYLAGYQEVETATYKVNGSNAAIAITKYGDTKVAPFAVVPVTEHSGGSND
jgi:hypothetical protein